jgi:hypothetical protein
MPLFLKINSDLKHDLNLLKLIVKITIPNEERVKKYIENNCSVNKQTSFPRHFEEKEMKPYYLTKNHIIYANALIEIE